jgi:hypothetical protein
LIGTAAKKEEETLREPEHAQGDSMEVTDPSSSSSWQILHCLSEQEHHGSPSCSILLRSLSFPGLQSVSLYLSARQLASLWLSMSLFFAPALNGHGFK